MKSIAIFLSTRLFRFGLLILVTSFLAISTAHARTITLSLEFERLQYSTIDPNYQGQTYYTVNVLVSSDIPSVTYDEVDSLAPNPVYGGSENGYSRTFYGDIGSAVNAATNGVWTLTVNKGDVSEKQYTFNVSAVGIDNNIFPAVQISSPVDGNASASTNSSFSWSGPALWDELDLVDHDVDYSFYTSDSPSPSATTWNNPPTLPLGTNEFEVSYKTNGVTWFTISTPVDNLSNPFSNWVGGAKLVDFVQSGFVTSTNPAATGGGGHTLAAHYTFDDGNNISQLGTDSSSNGNDMGSYSYWGPTHTNSTDAVAGGGAVQFFGTSSMDADNQSLTNLNDVLAGSFTFSTWMKTTVTNGADYNNAFFGAVIFWAYNDHDNTNDTIPLSITGSKVAFTTRDHLGNSDTLHSLTSVNDGNYHLITVTRDQTTGEKKIYVDGQFEASEIGTTDPLNGNNYDLTIGGYPYVIDGTGTNYSSYNGLLDDFQIYSGVLSATEVQSLYNNPGSTAPNVSTDDFNAALNTTNLIWTTGGDANWFTESTVTNNDALAAQSGHITDGQTNWIETTVTADGDLSFYWKVSSEDGWDYLTFYINGEQQDAISGDVDWNQETYSVSAGDVLRWEYTKDPDCCFDGADAGWLDQVVLPAGTGSQYPVDVDLQLNIIRSQDPNLGEYFSANVSFNSVNPEPTTTNLVQSPNNYFSAYTTPSSGSGSSAILSSLDQVINECTNGFWKLYINQGSPTQQVYSFQVSISGLDTNLLEAVKVFYPTNGAVNIATNPVFYWNGPTNYSTLQIELLSGPIAYPPVTATNWPSPPTLNYGSDRFDVAYTSNNFPGVTFTTPMDVYSNPVRTWATTVNLATESFNNFVVGAPVPLPVLLTNPTRTSSNLQFSFQTLAGRPHYIQSSTNLTLGAWVELTNFVGDGSLKQFTFPTTNPPVQFFRVKTQ